jgi:hypothetical protein
MSWSFQDPCHLSFLIDDEIQTPETDGCSGDPDCTAVIASHLELAELRRGTRKSPTWPVKCRCLKPRCNK